MITTDEINKAHNEEEQIQIDDESQQEQEKLLIKKDLEGLKVLKQ